MHTRPNRVVVTVSLLALAVAAFVAPVRADDDPDEAAAKEVAVAWFEALAGADWKKTLDVSDVPFLLDGKKVIETREELEKVYRKVAETKGAREIEIASVEIGKTEEHAATFEKLGTPKPDERIVVVIAVADDDEKILVCVKKGKEPKVIGFRD